MENITKIFWCIFDDESDVEIMAHCRGQARRLAIMKYGKCPVLIHELLKIAED